MGALILLRREAWCLAQGHTATKMETKCLVQRGRGRDPNTGDWAGAGGGGGGGGQEQVAGEAHQLEDQVQVIASLGGKNEIIEGTWGLSSATQGREKFQSNGRVHSGLATL